MSIISLLALLIIASIAGSIGAQLAGSSKKGCFASIALGFIGSFIGQLVAIHFHLPMLLSFRLYGQDFPVLWAIAGAALFVAVLNLFGAGKKD
ncbi:MAG: hypothetical protein RDV48_09550 [Candidatus Eremiobacteraeota bacterium]|nr:hypothetical protein [Candidatus Eremiobacteraeota bacterium]